MKILYLTKYSRKGASSRLRSYQYFPYLEANGFQITVKPLFDDLYLNTFYSKKKQNPIRILNYYIQRFLVLFTVYKYDRIVIEKELFPYFFGWFEKLLSMLGVKYIVDYDDAIFHNYDLSNNSVIKFLFKNKIGNVMKNSHVVISGNSYLASKAEKSGAKNVIQIPTVIDCNNYKVKEKYETNQVIIGWVGSPSTLKYIKPLVPVLEQLISKFNCKVHIVGAKEDIGITKNIEYFAWSEDKEVELIQNLDIGIMPLESTPWELGKCSYKLIQYMGCGLPVVASPVGMNIEVVEVGANGFLAESNEEWMDKLEQLITDSILREKLGKCGRVKAENEFNLQLKVSQLMEVLRN